MSFLPLPPGSGARICNRLISNYIESAVPGPQPSFMGPGDARHPGSQAMCNQAGVKTSTLGEAAWPVDRQRSPPLWPYEALFSITFTYPRGSAYSRERRLSR
jgi:hypothetical protein